MSGDIFLVCCLNSCMKWPSSYSLEYRYKIDMKSMRHKSTIENNFHVNWKKKKKVVPCVKKKKKKVSTVLFGSCNVCIDVCICADIKWKMCLLNEHTHSFPENEKKKKTARDRPKKTGQTFYLITFDILFYIIFCVHPLFLFSINYELICIFPFHLHRNYNSKSSAEEMIICPIFWWIEWIKWHWVCALAEKEEKKKIRMSEENEQNWQYIKTKGKVWKKRSNAISLVCGTFFVYQLSECICLLRSCGYLMKCRIMVNYFILPIENKRKKKSHKRGKSSRATSNSHEIQRRKHKKLSIFILWKQKNKFRNFILWNCFYLLFCVYIWNWFKCLCVDVCVQASAKAGKSRIVWRRQQTLSVGTWLWYWICIVWDFNNP